MSNDRIDAAVTAVAGIIIAVIVFTLSGTIVWMIWPVAIPAAFPALVASGVLAAKLSWWQAVCLNWVLGLLLRSTETSNK